MGVRNIKKQLAGEEDILLGDGVEQQQRHSGIVNVTKMRVTKVVATIEDMLALDTTKFLTCNVTDPDRGGVFHYDSTQAAINDGGTVFSGWVRQYDGPVNVKWFGVKGDGITDDTKALSSMQQYIKDNIEIDFNAGDIYLISNQSTSSEDEFSNFILNFKSVSNIKLNGNGCTFKGTDIDTSTKGLVIFGGGEGLKNFRASGFNFDITYKGRNNNFNYYPQAGCFLLKDLDNVGQSISLVSENISINNNTFKLFHPDGSYGHSDNPYNGDSNNGFKIYAISIFGVTHETDAKLQTKNINTNNNTFKDGHNAYGIWVWACASWLCEGNVFEAFVSKTTNSDGTFKQGGIPAIRNHQFYTSGVKIANNQVIGLSPDRKTIAGFEGDSSCIHLSQNIVGDYSHGDYIVTGNTLRTSGDAINASAVNVEGIVIAGYGNVNISNNIFEGYKGVYNESSGVSIHAYPQAVGASGKMSMSITDNIFAENLESNNIRLENGSTVSADDRRIKSLIVSGNTSLGQSQYFLDITGNSPTTYKGIENVMVTGNAVSGKYNVTWDLNSTNSIAYRFGSEANDKVVITNNSIVDKNIGFLFNDKLLESQSAIFQENTYSGVTTKVSNPPEPPTKFSTVNGTYIKYPDGTMVQHFDVVIDEFVNLTFPMGYTWTYPVPFVELPNVQFQVYIQSTTASSGQTSFLTSGLYRDLTSAVAGIARINADFVGDTVLINLSCTAIGRWK